MKSAALALLLLSQFSSLTPFVASWAPITPKLLRSCGALSFQESSRTTRVSRSLLPQSLQPQTCRSAPRCLALRMAQRRRLSDPNPNLNPSSSSRSRNIDIATADANPIATAATSTADTKDNTTTNSSSTTTTEEDLCVVMVDDDDDNTNNAAAEPVLTDTQKLLKQVKDAGTAGVISYALWELGFWLVSVPVVLFGYVAAVGHAPDLTNRDDLTKLGAEAFAFVNVARLAVPVRIGLALSTTPWIQANVVDTYLQPPPPVRQQREEVVLCSDLPEEELDGVDKNEPTTLEHKRNTIPRWRSFLSFFRRRNRSQKERVR